MVRLMIPEQLPVERDLVQLEFQWMLRLVMVEVQIFHLLAQQETPVCH